MQMFLVSKQFMQILCRLEAALVHDPSAGHVLQCPNSRTDATFEVSLRLDTIPTRVVIAGDEGGQVWNQNAQHWRVQQETGLKSGRLH